MRLLQFSVNGEMGFRLGILSKKGEIVEISGVGRPSTSLDFIEHGRSIWDQANVWEKEGEHFPLEEVQLKAAIHPKSIRDFYAFEEHVATAHANRGKQVPKEWYEIPVFYFSNPSPIFGPDEEVAMPSSTQALDYELEVAAIIGKGGRNISADKAGEHIFGYTIFNDWSARDVQRKEMKMGLGPAKGKDFASSLGPMIVTADELADHADGRAGVFDLEMSTKINGKEFSRGNWNTLHYSFGEMIARTSQDVDLYPGELIGSGTVGTGCLLELTKGKGPWLKKGDEVELAIEGIGSLANKVS